MSDKPKRINPYNRLLVIAKKFAVEDGLQVKYVKRPKTPWELQ